MLRPNLVFRNFFEKVVAEDVEPCTVVRRFTILVLQNCFGEFVDSLQSFGKRAKFRFRTIA